VPSITYPARRRREEESLAVPERPFPFVDDHIVVDDNPNEVRPTVDNPRFALLPPKANLTEQAYSKAGQKFVERVVEATNTGRDEGSKITPVDVPAGLVRAFEAVDAAPATNVSNLSAGSLKTVPTGDGELLTVEVLVNPLAIAPDPMNGRTIFDVVLHRLRLLDASADAAPLELPVYPLISASELLDMADLSRVELGFAGGSVAPGKDYNDLVSVGLQGVHEPVLLVPTLYTTPDGCSSWVVVAHDGNRRLSMVLRALKESTTAAWGDLTAWNRHLRDSNGPLLADFTAADVNALRQVAHFNDLVGGAMHPAGASPAELEAFLDGPAARSMRLRTLARCRAVRAQLVVGVNTSTVAPALRSEASVSAALVQRIVRRRHIEEAAQKPWSTDAQNIQVATAALRRVSGQIADGADLLPLDTSEVEAVLNSDIPAWPAAGDDNLHPLRMAVKVAATLVCDDHDGTAVVKDEMKAFNLSVHYNKIGENRAKLAAERIMPLLGFIDPQAARYKQVRSVIDRALRSKAFYDCARHPGRPNAWWEWINASGNALEAAMEQEQKEIGALSADELAARRDAAAGSGVWGPATRCGVMLALVSMAASPMVVGKTGPATPYAITLNGLGGTRGETMTTPDIVMFRVVDDPAGPRQLGEVIRSAVAGPTQLPRNVVDPDAEVDGHPASRGFLTEAFLRSSRFGWSQEKKKEGEGDSDGGPEPSPYESYQAWIARFSELVSQAHQEAAAVDADPALKALFDSHGFEVPDLASKLLELDALVKEAKFAFRRASGG
jgi:hypothetical protein